MSLILSLRLGTSLFADQPSVVRIWNCSVHDKKYQQKMYKLFNP